MSKVVTTHVVSPGAIADYLQPRDGVVVEAAAGDGRFVLERGPFTAYERVVTVAPSLP